MMNITQSRLVTGALSIVVALVISACCGGAKNGLAECRKAEENSTEGLKICYEAWKKYPDSLEWFDLTTVFDARLDIACKDSKRIKDCDTYCPLRIADPGPKNKTLMLSMCMMKGYGTLDSKTGASKPPRVSEMSPEVIEACVSQCKSLDANPSSPAYQSCFSTCKVKKVQELNTR